MKARELYNLGIPGGAPIKLALQSVATAAQSGLKSEALRERMRAVTADPAAHTSDPLFGELAALLIADETAKLRYVQRGEPAPWRLWGDAIEAGALDQMRNACLLPIAARGALMPDAHVGYGLPIGGVLATRDAVIPYAVGVDIACRMKLTVLDMPVKELARKQEKFIRAINAETRFGVGVEFRDRREHGVMDEDWSVSPTTLERKDKAWGQLGTSGSGNHFVEFGELTLAEPQLGLAPGTYLALLSHSGSRGVGACTADHYSRLAMSLHPELPKELLHLAWLDLASEPGQEYWNAMELLGRYAAANHELIHRHIALNLGAEVLLDVENHHNFAWKEMHGGPEGGSDGAEDGGVEGKKEEFIVHRKGATPAGAGVLGIIPGSMGTPGFLVRGLGDAQSLNSASHGAGRRMSRKAAKESFTWHAVKKFLAERNVTLLSAGLDEAPMAYKDIEAVMAAQTGLVEPLARFEPRVVKMAEAGEKPED